MIPKGIVSLYRYCFKINNGELEEKTNSPLINIDGNVVTIKGDLEIKIEGNLKIKTEKHLVLKTSKLPSNDEYDVYSIHLNPKDESYNKLGNDNE